MTPRRRVHVVGCPRSGTTLVMELLWASYALGGRCAHEASLFDEPSPPVDRYLSKKPSDTYRVPAVIAADAQLYVVAVQRDPRAVLCSRHARRPDEYYCDFPRWQRHQRAIDALAGHPRCATVVFERLLAQPDAVQRELTAALPVLGEVRGRFSDYPDGAHVSVAARTALNGTRPFDPSRLDGWREHLPRIAQQLRAFPEMQDELERLGYCTGTQWQTELAAVAPLPGRASQRPHLFKRWETELRFASKVRRYKALHRGG